MEMENQTEQNTQVETGNSEEHFYDREIKEAAERLRLVFGISPEADLPGINGRSLELLYDDMIRKLQFPFQGEYKMGKAQEERIMDVQVDGLLDPDETPDLLAYGLVALVQIPGEDGEPEGVKIPLAEIVIKYGDPNYDLIEDYCIWFWDQISKLEI